MTTKGIRLHLDRVQKAFCTWITGLFLLVDQTRNQRDVLVNGADHLFSDIRVVSAGDLRVNAAVTNDPIGMLASAFNLAIGRFRRFIQNRNSVFGIL